DNAQTLARLQESPDLLAMQELLEAAKRALLVAKQAHGDARTALGSAQKEMETTNSRYEECKDKADRLAIVASTDMRQDFVDAGWIDGRRTDWERQGKTLQE